MERQKRKILVIRFSSLGDIILTLGAISLLRENDNKMEIYFALKKEYMDLITHDCRIYKIVPLDLKNEHRGAIGFLKYIGELKINQFDYIIDFHNNLRSRLISLSLFHIKTVHYRKYHFKRWLLTTFLKRFVKFNFHTTELYEYAVRKIFPNIQCDHKIPRLYNSNCLQKKRNNALILKKPVIAIFPGAKWSNKEWGIEKFAHIAKEIVESVDCSVIIILGPEEDKFNNEFKSIIDLPNIRLIDKLSILELLELISNCNICVTNDSGPSHIAEALGIPVLVIFGPTNPRLGFGPLLSESKIISVNKDCSPCSLHGEKPCKKEKRFCMDEISVEMVLNAIKHSLAVQKIK